MKIKDIENPKFLKEYDINQLNTLSQDIRDFLIKSISKTGGHLSSNLGVVELTVALHYVFDSPRDKFIFDVGHQSYVHKILTGRAKEFSTLRQYQGISGFQKRKESIHDVWEAGHSSTAISAACAMAITRDLEYDDFSVIPIVGDASIVSGEALEAINFLGSINNKVIIVLNDNQMSINQSVGGLDQFLNKVRISNTYSRIKKDYLNIFNHGKLGKSFIKLSKNIKDTFKKKIVKDTLFNQFGLDYLGPVDGHNIGDLIKAFSIAKKYDRSLVVHVVTKKGKGYKFAEKDLKGSWHGTIPFDIATGNKIEKYDRRVSWSEIVADELLLQMEKNRNIVTITPAMIFGSCLDKVFKKFPNRSFDVGIAEEHAATLVAGFSLAGKLPVLSIYSSFSQRCYDQINHDIARMDTPALIILDRAGLVGNDGPTHHGVFDLSIFQALPNIIYFAPSNSMEARAFINTALYNRDHPYIMRVSKNKVPDIKIQNNELLEIGSWPIVASEPDYECIIIAYGDNVDKLKLFKRDIKIKLINARFIKPIDTKRLLQLEKEDKPIFVYETVQKIGSLGQTICSYFNDKNISKELHCFGIEDHYCPQGSNQEILIGEGLDVATFYQNVKEIING